MCGLAFAYLHFIIFQQIYCALHHLIRGKPRIAEQWPLTIGFVCYGVFHYAKRLCANFLDYFCCPHQCVVSSAG